MVDKYDPRIPPAGRGVDPHDGPEDWWSKMGILPPESLENRLSKYNHVMALIRTVCSVISLILGLCILIKVFEII